MDKKADSVAVKRDEVLRRMLATPPKLHGAPKVKPKESIRRTAIEGKATPR